MRVFLFFLEYVILNEAKLLFAQVFFRHGARYPFTTQNFTFDPSEQMAINYAKTGQLTVVSVARRSHLQEGKASAYKVGKRLRSVYGKLLSKHYVEQEIGAFHTDVPRTMNSLQLVLAGLLPPSGDEIWNKKLMWQPVPYYTDRNMIYSGFKHTRTLCPTEFHKLSSTGAYDDLWSSIDSHLLSYLRKATGEKITDYFEFMAIADAIITRYEMGDKLILEQPWFKETLIPWLSKNIFQVFNYLSKVGKQTSKIQISRIADIFDKFLNNDGKRLVLFAVHDSNLMRIARLLKVNVYTENTPGYVAHLALELHEEDDDTIVKNVTVCVSQMVQDARRFLLKAAIYHMSTNSSMNTDL